MLVLSRKLNETIRIGDDVCLTIVALEPGAVKLGIQAPARISVHRGEVYERIQHENRQAARPLNVELARLVSSLYNSAKQGSAAKHERGHSERNATSKKKRSEEPDG